MKIEIDEFVLDNVFHHVPASPGALEFWWRQCAGPGEGYLILWADGSHHHTYHHPEN